MMWSQDTNMSSFLQNQEVIYYLHAYISQYCEGKKKSLIAAYND